MMRAPAAAGDERGIGRALAVGLARAGADIIGVSASLESDSEVGREVRAQGRAFAGYACDFADRAALYRFIEQVSGVNVNAIAPGYIETDNTAALQSDPERGKQILDRIPAGRWGKPEDLVGAALFLASPLADYVHGAILSVDGGWMGR